MPAVKGSGRIPCGPCANLCCPHGLDTCYNCVCDGQDLHSVYAPTCTLVAHAGFLRDPAGAGPQIRVPMTAANLATGRQLARTAGADGSEPNGGKGQATSTGAKHAVWRKVNAAQRVVMAGVLLPDEAVICGECYKNFNILARHKNPEITELRQREHAERLIAENISALTDRLGIAFLMAFASLITLFAWLGRGSAGSTGSKPATKTGKQTRVWRTAAHDTNVGDYTGGQPSNRHPGVPAVAAEIAVGALKLCGTAAVGFGAFGKAYGDEIWVQIGDAIYSQLKDCVASRLVAIKDKRLHRLTGWADDFATIPRALQVLVMHMTAGRIEVSHL